MGDNTQGNQTYNALLGSWTVQGGAPNFEIGASVGGYQGTLKVDNTGTLTLGLYPSTGIGIVSGPGSVYNFSTGLWTYDAQFQVQTPLSGVFAQFSQSINSEGNPEQSAGLGYKADIAGAVGMDIAGNLPIPRMVDAPLSKEMPNDADPYNLWPTTPRGLSGSWTTDGAILYGRNDGISSRPLRLNSRVRLDSIKV